jgi:hypothetical protein
MARNQERIPPFEEGYQAGELNRATQMRRDTDTVKIPKVTLYDIDYAIMYHLSTNMKLKVREDNRMIDVPVLYADGEKWAQIRSRGFLRDEKNKVMAPMIAIRRSSVEPDSRLPYPDLNNYVPFRKFYPYKTMNMQYDKLSGQTLRKPSYDFYMVDVPNYVRVQYDLIIWTNMVEQMNGLVQAIVAVSNHLWGDYHTFRAVVNNASMNTTNNVGEDRVVSTTISMQVDGWLQEEFEYHEPTMRKAHTVKTVKFENEKEEFDFYTEMPSPFFPNKHISSEPKHIQLMNKRRNLRYR